MVKFILIKSPDEWATTKQACRDELVVYLFFSPIYILLYFHVLSTVLRTSSLHFIYIYIYIIMINGSKISVHRFIATTLFRMIEG